MGRVRNWCERRKNKEKMGKGRYERKKEFGRKGIGLEEDEEEGWKEERPEWKCV